MAEALTTQGAPTEHEAHVAEGKAKGRLAVKVECPACDGFGAFSVPGPACPVCHGEMLVDALLPEPASGPGDLIDAACASLAAANDASQEMAAYNGSFQGSMEAAATARTVQSCKDAIRGALASGTATPGRLGEDSPLPDLDAERAAKRQQCVAASRG